MIDIVPRAAAARHHELAERFIRLRRVLLNNRYESRLAQPLSNWVTPADRRLPHALLGCRLSDLLRQSYESIACTAGIGQAKIETLLRLFDRALHADDLNTAAVEEIGSTAGVSAVNISEITWAEWRAQIAASAFRSETFGRFVYSLNELPRALWEVPFESYLNLSLDDIRRLKTHGPKRVACILSIFGQLVRRFQDGGNPYELLAPRIVAVESWLQQQRLVPTIESVRIQAELLSPLVEQIRLDLNDHVAEFIERRFGRCERPISIRRAAHELRLTRARIYQLLHDARRVIAVRWPRGRSELTELLDRLRRQPNVDVRSVQMTANAVSTLFECERRERVAPPTIFESLNNPPANNQLHATSAEFGSPSID